MVFIRKKDVDEHYPIGVELSRKMVKGEVGLEIEVEGNKFPKPPGMEMAHNPVRLEKTKFWSYVHDGSLRGKDNAEYVLTSPISFSEVPAALDELFSFLREYGSVIDLSNRTSTHVHLNVTGFYLNRLTALLALYYMLETPLTEFCGEHRVGNLFCLRAKDTPAVVSQLRKFIKTGMGTVLREGNHYAGLNAYALHKQGSIEFRTMRGVQDAQPVKDWVSILQRLYEVSGSFPDPREVVADFSFIGPLQWFENILGDRTSLVRDNCGMSSEEIRSALYEGMRLAQDLCYARDWSTFKTLEHTPDPFGRSAKVVKRRQSSTLSQTVSEAIGTEEEEFLQWANEQAHPEEDFPAPPISPPQHPSSLAQAAAQFQTVTLSSASQIWGNPFAN